MAGVPERSRSERGYSMAVLLVVLAIMGVALSAAMPLWRTVVQRENEEELIFRGRQYTRAIGLFQRRFANAFPPSVDVLVEQKFLRKKFRDPMTHDGEFEILYQGSALTLPGGRGSQFGTVGRQTGSGAGAFGAATGPGAGRGQGGMSMTTTVGGGARGGVIGVASKSKDKSFRILDGRSQYNEWQFVWTAVATPGRGGGVNQPGGQGAGMSSQPGMPGPRGRGGQPGGPGRGPGDMRVPSGGRGPGR